jgi:ADP-heptose:LPS heptosyltransferase
MENVTRLAIKGGIGDFLQCVPFVIKHRDFSYVVASHYNRVPEFFKFLGVTIKEEPFARIENIPLCPRQLFFDRNPFGERLWFSNERPTLGLHLGASKYSNSLAKRYGFPPKNLPRAVLTLLLDSIGGKYNLLLFGESLELDSLLPGWRTDICSQFTIIAHDSIATSLSYVSGCDYFIGSDSGLKTMSSMLGIPTVVWMGNHKDESTESTFINPYVEAGIMSVFRYNDLESPVEIQAGIEFSLAKFRELGEKSIA